jgi:hypothetical protein
MDYAHYAILGSIALFYLFVKDAVILLPRPIYYTDKVYRDSAKQVAVDTKRHDVSSVKPVPGVYSWPKYEVTHSDGSISYTYNPHVMDE